MKNQKKKRLKSVCKKKQYERGALQTHNFHVFAHKLGNQGGIYFFLKLPVWVKISKNLVVFQPKNPKKKLFFQKFRNLKFDVFFSRAENFFYVSKSKETVSFFDRDLVKNQNNLNFNIFVPEFDLFCRIFRLFS